MVMVWILIDLVALREAVNTMTEEILVGIEILHLFTVEDQEVAGKLAEVLVVVDLVLGLQEVMAWVEIIQTCVQEKGTGIAQSKLGFSLCFLSNTGGYRDISCYLEHV